MSEALRKAVQDYQRAVVSLVHRSLPAPATLIAEMREAARKPYVRAFGFDPVDKIVFDLRPEIDKLPEAHTLLCEIQADPELSHLWGKVADSEHGVAIRLQPSMLVGYILVHLPIYGALEFDPREFDRFFSALRTVWCAGKVRVRTMAVMTNLRCDLDELILEDGVSLHGAKLDAPIGQVWPMLAVSPFANLGFVVEASRTVELALDSPLKEPRGGCERDEETVRAILRCMAVFKSGDTDCAGIIRFTESPLAPGCSVSDGLRPAGEARSLYTLSPDEARDFVAFWRIFRSVGNYRWLDIAVRRFAEATLRGRWQDTLLDLMIAAETLFLTDVGSPQDRGELKFRLSLRAAAYLADDSRAPNDVFRVFGEAYKARSTLVHGGAVDRQDQKLRALTANVEDWIRIALKKAICEVAEAGNKRGIDWDAHILKKLSPKAQ